MYAFWPDLPSPQRVAPARSVPPVAGPEQGAGPSIDPSGVASHDVAGRSPSSRLQHEFLASDNLYAFAEAARRRPREGGIFYAREATDYCSYARPDFERAVLDAMTTRPAIAGAVNAKRSDAIERYRRRCDGFRSLDVDAYYRGLVNDPTARDDPLETVLATFARASKSRDVSARLDALQAMLDLHDPLLLSSKFAYFMDPDRVEGGSSGGLWFDGHDYRQSDDEATEYIDALTFAGCRPDAPCKADTQRYLSCLGRGVCVDSNDIDVFADDDRVDRVDRDARRRAWDRILALTDRIRGALDRGDLNAFRAPGGARR